MFQLTFSFCIILIYVNNAIEDENHIAAFVDTCIHGHSCNYRFIIFWRQYIAQYNLHVNV